MPVRLVVMYKSNRGRALEEMRAILGPDASEKHMIHSLHLARDDVSSAINIFLDTPQGECAVRPSPAARQPTSHRDNSAVSVTIRNEAVVSSVRVAEAEVKGEGKFLEHPVTHLSLEPPTAQGCQKNIRAENFLASSASQVFPAKIDGSCLQVVVKEDFIAPANGNLVSSRHKSLLESTRESRTTSEFLTSGEQLPIPSSQRFRKGIPNLTKCIHRIDLESEQLETEYNCSDEWMLLGATNVLGCSTCKGVKVQVGDPIFFTYPQKEDKTKPSSDGRRQWGRAKGPVEIVRFCSRDHGEIGRLPRDWENCIIPLVHSNKVKLEGTCKDVPAVLEFGSTIFINVRVLINRNLFAKYDRLWRNPLSTSNEATTNLPLPSLLAFLGHKPVQKAEFTPEDLMSRKRSMESGKHECSSFTKRQKLAAGVSEAEGEEEQLSDRELNEIVGTSDANEIEEMEPSSLLQSTLWPYQKQALCWMTKRETGGATEDAAMTLHPCWASYQLADKRVPVFYLNVFTGEATLDFPSAIQTAKGGILADAMGLGKTVMTISLIVTNPGRGGSGDVISLESSKQIDPSSEVGEVNSRTMSASDQFGDRSKTLSAKGGGTLIVCPMSLLAQWKSEFETHVAPGHLRVHTYYGGDRFCKAKDLLKYDIVLTTYHTLQAEHSKSPLGSPIQSVHWFRIVLDEAHNIKNSRSACAQAIFSLSGGRCWCLTGTPIQNKLEDVFSLLHVIRVEPWANWAWWNKLIQRPFEEGNEGPLSLLQDVLRPLMLRRTKDTLDKEGRPILKLPPADIQFVYCELSDAERDFYEAVHKKSKVKFDKFVEQGKVLQNYASVLELLLKMRQCCDHPFLVLSRSDTEDFADLDKLAKRFLDGGDAGEHGAALLRPTKAFVEEVVADLRNGDNSECPICLEAMEDAVLTKCAHRMCRECLLSSWRSTGAGKCPMCRSPVSKQDLITAPTGSRFIVDPEKNWTDSSKVIVLMQYIDAAQASGTKSVIFSQWTAFLDLLEIPLKRRKTQYVRLDGTLSLRERQRVLAEFNDNPKTSVILLSLKAGGVGLNLTAASNAFLLDPWWNPAVEDQAIMRIHRIGQTKAVVVKRFIVKGSVEEKMLQVQGRKQRMINGALTEERDAIKSARIEELKMLFR